MLEDKPRQTEITIATPCPFALRAPCSCFLMIYKKS
uniref:Uncharacterized protein n=1 Tax=Anguilla anguilla TaxID=7936 RepID=A0A0E9PVU6_ANGAN